MKGKRASSQHLATTGILIHSRNDADYMPMTDTYSPVLHRIDQAVRWRAVHPTEPVPPPYEILTRYSKPPGELVAKARRQLDKLVAAADVKKGKLRPCPSSRFRTQLLILHSPTKSSKPQTQPQRNKTPLRPRRQRPPRHQAQKTEDLPRKPHPRVQTSS